MAYLCGAAAVAWIFLTVPLQIQLQLKALISGGPKTLRVGGDLAEAMTWLAPALGLLLLSVVCASMSLRQTGPGK